MDESTNKTSCNCGNGNCKGNCGGKKCGCHHHKVFPICLIVVGLLVIASAFGLVIDTMVWEIIFGAFLVIIGGMKLMHSKCKCC